MTLAELHGKLTVQEESEDLLTSDVFGTFKYVSPGRGLIPFLRTSKNLLGESFREHGSVVDAEYLFWPKTTGFHREPDVLCILTAQDGTVTTIMVECKYTSPKSNSLNTRLWSQGDQLAEQYYDLATNRLNVSDATYEKISSSERKYLFYVTAHYALPRADIQESAALLRNKGVIDSYNGLFWTSWRKVNSVIEPQIEDSETDTMTVRLLTDLRLLLHRKRLVPFQGFKAVDSFNFDGINRPFFWRQVESKFRK